MINIILWTILGGKFGFSREQVPLHFNVIYGIDFVGKAYEVYQLPLLGLVILVANFFVGKIVYPREKLFSMFLLYGAATVQVFLAIAVAALVVLNS